MKARARQWSPDIRQIDLDVNRTYRNHLMFRERYNVKYVVVTCCLLGSRHSLDQFIMYKHTCA